MDYGELALEGAGLALIAALMAGVFAAVGERRRLVFGICAGLALGLLLLPFIAYLVARITNHHADAVDLAPPAYIIVTALSCAMLAIIGGIWGAIAEMRHARRGRLETLRRQRDPDAAYRDDVREWLPWGQRDWPK
jgi:hypothetical protein